MHKGEKAWRDRFETETAALTRGEVTVEKFFRRNGQLTVFYSDGSFKCIGDHFGNNWQDVTAADSLARRIMARGAAVKQYAVA